MIHPHTEVRWVNDQIGNGVFATRAIPAGTMTYVWDPLEVEIGPDDPRLQEPPLADVIERYSYIDRRGVRIISWDNAKFVNHSCDPNTLSSGYGFEIAIRDIEPGEQLTDDYGMFNLPYPMPVSCCEIGCRGLITPNDLDLYWPRWDVQVHYAINMMNTVTQPLVGVLDETTKLALARYHAGIDDYVSVSQLRTEELAISARPPVLEASLRAR